MNTSKSKLLLFVLPPFVLSIAALIYFISESTETKILELNFVSNCSICNEGELIPSNVAMFSDVYSDSEHDVVYISKSSFKRLDIDRTADSIFFSKPITKEADPNEMLEMFKSERSYISATTSMFLNEPKRESKSIDQEVKMVKHFFLVCPGNTTVDNHRVFDSPDALKRYISDEIKSGRLNENGFKPNSIVIVLDCCNGSAPTASPGTTEKGNEDNSSQEKKVVTETTKSGNNQPQDQPKKYSANIRQSGNTISWSADLASADQLTLVFKSEVDGKVLVSADVSGRSSYYFSYSNSVYEGSKIKVSISGTWQNGSKIIGSSSFSTTTLECH